MQATEVEIEIASDRRQRNRDDARFQKRRTRPEDDGGERPAPTRTRVPQRLGRPAASDGWSRAGIHDQPWFHSSAGGSSPQAAREAALRELRRVLKPGGSLRFVEHGLAPDEKVRRFQHRAEPIQKRLFGGCHLTRRIPDLIRDAGFAITELDVY